MLARELVRGSKQLFNTIPLPVGRSRGKPIAREIRCAPVHKNGSREFLEVRGVTPIIIQHENIGRMGLLSYRSGARFDV